MPELILRRHPERQGCWHVFCDDVRIGTITQRTGCPLDVEPWEWVCGFSPGTKPGEYRNGTGATFDEARIGF